MARRGEPLFGVKFFGGRNSLKKWTYTPLLRHRASPFNGVCFLIQWKYTKSSLYGPHLRCNKPVKINYGRASLENSKYKYSKYFWCHTNQRNYSCGSVGKKSLIWLNSPGFELLMRQILIYFDSLFTCTCTSKVFHFYFIFLDGNYRVLLTRAKLQKNPYNRNPVKKALYKDIWNHLDFGTSTSRRWLQMN